VIVYCNKRTSNQNRVLFLVVDRLRQIPLQSMIVMTP